MANHGKKPMLWLGLAALGGVALGAAAWKAGELLVSLALDRRMPKMPEKGPRLNLAGYDEDRELIELVQNATRRLHEYPCEDVEIRSHDGLRLVGHYFPVENEKRLLIAFHGWRSAWDRDFAVVSEYWREMGCSVLYVEQRAQGESEGECMGFGLLERFDCLAWSEYAMERFGEIPTYLVGVSMGASSVMMSSSLALPRNIHGMIADCGYTSPEAIWRHVAENNMHIPYDGPASYFARLHCRRKIGMEPGETSCPEALAKSKTPILFIHGTGDHFVPVGMTYENFKACAAPKRLFIAPGAEHGQSYLADTEGYKRTVSAFWQELD